MSSHNPLIVLAKVDANEEKNKDLASQYDVKGFPTINILRNRGNNVQEYKGPREADGIVDYLKKQSGPASTEIKFADEPTAFVGENKVAIVSDRLFCFRFISSHTGLFIISSYVFRLEFFWRLV